MTTKPQIESNRLERQALNEIPPDGTLPSWAALSDVKRSGEPEKRTMTTYDPTNTKDWQIDGSTVFLLEEVQRHSAHTVIQNKFYAQVNSAGRQDRGSEEAVAAQICAALNKSADISKVLAFVEAGFLQADTAWQDASETGAAGYYRGRRAAFSEVERHIKKLFGMLGHEAKVSKADGT